MCVSQSPRRDHQVGQTEQRVQPRRVLGQPAIADLLQTKQILDDVKRMLDLGAHTRLQLLEFFEHSPHRVVGQRTPLAPDLPTTAEAGLPGWEALGSFGIFTTNGTPTDIINRVNAEVTRILRLPDIRDRILATGNEPAPTTPEEFGAFIKAEVSKWIRVLKESNTQVN